MKKNHKFLKRIAVLFSCLVAFSSEAQNYAWMKGSNLQDQQGTYGTIGVPAAANNPGAREAAMRWKDASGNLWLFGGGGFDASNPWDILNDLWKYNPTTNQWTWMKGDNTAAQPGVYGTIGVAAPANKPGSRIGGVSWADGSGNLWLFGGFGYDAFSSLGFLNDLWKYNIVSNQWTWIKGSNITDQNGTYGTITVPAGSSNPGGRILGVAWADAGGNLWMFGGMGYDQSSISISYLNDMWRYNITTNQWTWMKGSNLSDQVGNYGTINVAAASNVPGARMSADGVSDASGNLWMLGGSGWDASTTGELADLWRYNVITNQWTWVKGSSAVDQNGIYGTQGVPAASNVPGSRDSHTMWSDASGNIWLFGGNAFDASSTFQDYINDLWRYNIASGQWTWMKGSNSQGQGGTYGTLGVPAAANTPGARANPVSWIDAANNLWQFGGVGYDNNFNFGDFNDLWKLSNCAAQALTVTANPVSTCPFATTTLSVSGAATYTWSTQQFTSAIVVSPSVTTGYTVASTDGSGCTNFAIITHSVHPAAQVSVSGSPSVLCSGDVATLTGVGATNYTWSTNATVPTITVNPTISSNYTIQGINSNGCKGDASYTQTVSALPTVTVGSNKGTIICKGTTATLTAGGASSYSWHTTPANSSNSLQVQQNSTGQYTYTVTGTNSVGCKSSNIFTLTVAVCPDGLQEAAGLLNIMIFPNPTLSRFSISSESIEIGKDVLLITNAVGQKVLKKTLDNQSTTIEAGISAGLYQCQIIRDGEVLFTGRLVIQ